MALHVTVTLDCSAADLPQYLQLVLGHSPLQAGLWALPVAIGAITGSLLAATLARAVRPGWLIGGGLLIAAGGYLTLSALDLDGTAWIAFTGGTLIGAGIGIADTVSNDVIVGTAPPEKAGAAAGISETAYELAGPRHRRPRSTGHQPLPHRRPQGAAGHRASRDRRRRLRNSRSRSRNRPAPTR